MNPAEANKLYKASREGSAKEIAELLLKVNPKHPSDRDFLNRALVAAVLGNSLEAVDLLLKAGANPEQKTIVGTLLSGAAMNGNLPLVRRLIAAGANYNRELKKETALSAALSEHAVPVIEYLEQLGAYSPSKATLLYSCIHGDMERAKRALAEGADVEEEGGFFEETPLMAAARKGRSKMVDFLLQNGANPNKRVKARTALFDAVERGGNQDVFEALIAAGADIHSKEYDKSVLMAAAEGGSVPIVKRLVELGANIQERDKTFNKTALDYAKMAKQTAVVKYLSGLGITSDRDATRKHAKALAKEYGGKPIEHSQGFLLNSHFDGNDCQFQLAGSCATLMVVKLNLKDAELKRAKMPGLIVGEEKTFPKTVPKVTVPAAQEILGIKVQRASGTSAISESYIIAFCRKYADILKQMGLSKEEHLGITSEYARFSWTLGDIDKNFSRLNLFKRLLKEISSPALPKRQVFAMEWLIQRVSNKTKNSATTHSLGGALEKPVTCPHCGLNTHLMAQIDLSDPVLTPTSFGTRIPLFWCLECLEWDAAFFDLSGPIPKPFKTISKSKRSANDGNGEENLPECKTALVAVPQGKKAGQTSKIGGSPNWIQSDSTPHCPKCEKPMAFLLQLASDSRISFCDMGMFYAFICPECKLAASLIQSH